MSCICCFFDNEHQKLLKIKCFTKNSFRNNLLAYRDEFIDELLHLNEVCKCSCAKKFSQNNIQVLMDFFHDVLTDFKTKRNIIERFFDDIIKIYDKIDIDRAESFKMMSTFLEHYCTNYSSRNALQFCDILFRGRNKGSYDVKDIHEFYHIPFSKTSVISAQRFSCKGKPMLYLAKSILTAEKEIKDEINNLNFSLFLPKYSWFYRSGMYNFENSIAVTINNAIPSMVAGGAIIKYENDRFTFSKSKSNKFLIDSILFQILTFPVEDYKEEEEICEYKLPQLCVEYYEKCGYKGVIYQSTKTLNELSTCYERHEMDYNYCFFIPQEEPCCEYNENVLDCFHTVCIGECDNHTHADLMDYLKSMESKLKTINKTYNMNDSFLVLQQINHHLNNMEKVKIAGINYFDCEEGKNETCLIFVLLQKIEAIVTSPDKHGIIKN